MGASASAEPYRIDTRPGPHWLWAITPPLPRPLCLSLAIPYSTPHNFFTSAPYIPSERSILVGIFYFKKQSFDSNSYCVPLRQQSSANCSTMACMMKLAIMLPIMSWTPKVLPTLSSPSRSVTPFLLASLPRSCKSNPLLFCSDITLREVQGLVSHYRQSCLWDIEQERMVRSFWNITFAFAFSCSSVHFEKLEYWLSRKNLWSKCQQSFMEHKINPEIAGDFFYNLGTSPEKATSGTTLHLIYWNLYSISK